MRKQFLLPVLIAIGHTAFSQSDSLQFTLLNDAKITREAGDPLFYGLQYVGYETVIKGSPFYANDDWQKGTIVYRGIAYKDIWLKYELVKDEVLVLHPNGFTPVVLFSPRIASFTLGEKKFVNLPPAAVAPLKAGIYEEITSGPITVYAKRSRLLNEMVVGTQFEREFVDNYSFYASKDDRFIPVKKEKLIMDLLGEKKRESKSLLKKAGIKFRKAPEAALRLIVDSYNQSSR